MKSIDNKALTTTNTWSLIPPLGNLDAYITATYKIPMLTLEEEQRYGRMLKDTGDIECATKLILSHLKLVVAVARQYMGYGLPHGDLIQEGNVGLLEAVNRFDPEQNVRLAAYAMYWIKANIHEYIIRNWRMVKIATTKAHRKLFFKLRSTKQNLRSDVQDGETHHDTMTDDEIDIVAQELNVSREDVIEMEARMAGRDVAIDQDSDEDGEYSNPIIHLPDSTHEPSLVLETKRYETMANEGVAAALATLDARSRRIVEERWINVNDDGKGGMTLHELAAEYGVSYERIRQIEVAAMKKLKTALKAYTA